MYFFPPSVLLPFDYCMLSFILFSSLLCYFRFLPCFVPFVSFSTHPHLSVLPAYLFLIGLAFPSIVCLYLLFYSFFIISSSNSYMFFIFYLFTLLSACLLFSIFSTLFPSVWLLLLLFFSFFFSFFLLPSILLALFYVFHFYFYFYLFFLSVSV
jgi:hypothetical protein